LLPERVLRLPCDAFFGILTDKHKIMGDQKTPTYANGKICYIDIPAVDITESAEFYQKTFGWRIRTRGDGSVAFDDGAGEVSGTWSIGRFPMSEAGFIIYIMVDSVAETAEAVLANGGRIVQPIGMDAPEITARFTDPAGNVLGLYQQPQ
jgi:predicted enzyme related to lactoylglutathione lyase